MQKFYDEAMEILNSFEDSVYKQSLGQLVQFTIERNK